MTYATIRIPADLSVAAIIHALRPLGLEPTNQHDDADHALTFDRAKPRDLPTCAEPGCTAPGTVRWSREGSAAYCADHAWPRRPQTEV
jgi:hypothetical protein